MTEVDYAALLCRWAEAQYGLTHVTHVDFALLGGDNDGCDTCGYGSTPARLEVTVKHGSSSERQQYSHFEEEYVGDLITSILASRHLA